MIRSLQDHFTRFRNPSLDLPEKVLASRRERMRILEASKRGDGQLAERLVHEHFDHAGRLLLESLLTHPQRGKEARVTMGLGD
jgi:DNA-binding GntR family transcriptional regulator